MGKTALAAETLALWEVRFDWVLLYQAKPNPLGLDATLRDIDLRLKAERARPETTAGRIPPLPSTAAPATFTGPERQDRVMRDLRFDPAGPGPAAGARQLRNHPKTPGRPAPRHLPSGPARTPPGIAALHRWRPNWSAPGPGCDHLPPLALRAGQRGGLLQ